MLHELIIDVIAELASQVGDDHRSTTVSTDDFGDELGYGGCFLVRMASALGHLVR